MTPDRPTRPGARAGAVLLVGLALALMPAAAAAPVVSGHLVASTVAVQGAAEQAGTLEVLFALRPDGQGVPAIHFEGGQVMWRAVEDKGPAVEGPGGVRVATAGAERSAMPPPGWEQESNARYDATEAQGHFEFRLYSLGGIQQTSSADSLTLTALQKPYVSMAEGLIEYDETESADAVDDPRDPPTAQFTQFILPSAVVLTTPEGRAEVSVQGDFVLEFLGVTGAMVGDGGTHQLQSGDWRRPVVGGAPDSNAYEEDRIFLRAYVTQGLARVVFEADTMTQWAGPGTGTSAQGPATFASATGTLTAQDGGVLNVNAARYTLGGRNVLQATPAPAGLDIGLTGLDADGVPLRPDGATVQHLPFSLTLGLAGGMAVLAATGISAWYAVARRRRAAMPDVEAALESGRYRRAARQAARILRRHPRMETALISRAIALSKVGRNRRVVAEVGRHLEGHEPSDGVLHYVLGIAYVDLGRQREAESAFREALRRTPDLLPEVQGRLPSGSRAPAPSTKSPADSHGYA